MPFFKRRSMQRIIPSETLDDLQHKAARLVFNGESFLSPRMDEADSAAVEKEAISAEILRKSAVQRPFAVSRISDDRMCEMFEMSSQLMTPAGSEFKKN